MKKLTLGVAVATAACIIAGPALAAVPAFAAAERLDNHFSRLILQDTEASTGKYIAIGSDLTGQRFDTLAEAEASAGSEYFDLPRPSTDGLSMSNLESGETLTVDAAAHSVGYATEDLTKPSQLWDVDASGHAESEAGGYLAFDDDSHRLNTSDDDRYAFAGGSTGEAPSPIAAKVDSYDASKGEALIRGSAESIAFGADVQIAWGEGQFVSTEDDGTFVALVTGITPGQKSITLTQTVDGTKYDTLTIPLADESATDKPFAMTSPTPGDTFTPGKTATFTGTGQAGDTITLHVTNFTSGDTTTTVQPNGEWTIKRGLGDGNYVFDITPTSAPSTAITGFAYNPTPS